MTLSSRKVDSEKSTSEVITLLINGESRSQSMALCQVGNDYSCLTSPPFCQFEDSQTVAVFKVSVPSYGDYRFYTEVSCSSFGIWLHDGSGWSDCNSNGNSSQFFLDPVTYTIYVGGTTSSCRSGSVTIYVTDDLLTRPFHTCFLRFAGRLSSWRAQIF